MRKALYLMGILEDSDTEWLTEHGKRQFIANQAVLIHEGKPMNSLYIILDGQFVVHTGAQQIAVLYAGEVVGEISFVDSRPPLATVTATKDSFVLSVSRETLQTKMDRDPKFAANFYRGIATYLADRLRVTTGRLGFGSADQDRDQKDELDDDLMDTLSLAALRFDRMLKRLQSEPA
jgi:CRP/FNR family cyclic AMP-dependent transcriptional regulator